MTAIHDTKHRVTEMRILPGSGMAVLVEQSFDDRHTQIVLAHGEGDREIISCWEDDEPAPHDEWGISFDGLVDVIAHIAAHLTGRLPPGDPCLVDF